MTTIVIQIEELNGKAAILVRHLALPGATSQSEYQIGENFAKKIQDNAADLLGFHAEKSIAGPANLTAQAVMGEIRKFHEG